MKIKTLLFTLIGLAMTLVACSSDNNNDGPITVSGIEFKPNVFLSEGKIVGVDADIASQAMESAGISTQVNLSSSWDEAYQATLNGPARALLTVGYSKERKDLFKWAGPTSKGAYEVFAKASSGVGVGIGVEASKEIGSIAVVEGWLETKILEDLGFKNLHYYSSYEAAVTAFKNNEVKAIASDRAQFVMTVSLDYYLQQDIGVACVYHDVFYFIAFSKDVDDDVVSRCQDAIDAMITNGTTFAILHEYVPYAIERMTPGLIQIFTEEDPPFNYFTEVSGANITLTGSSVEIVNEIQSQNSYKNPIDIASWVSGYDLLQYMPNFALFTTARTPERENLFQWVGPIAAHRTHFYTRASSGIQVETLEQAKALNAVATPKGWYTNDFLINNGFQNILATAYTSEQAFNQLLSGEADALLLDETAVKWLCDKTGTPQESLTAQLEIDNFKSYIAFSLDTPKSVVDQWQDNLDDMKEDGRFEAIWNKWYAGIEMP